MRRVATAILLLWMFLCTGTAAHAGGSGAIDVPTVTVLSTNGVIDASWEKAVRVRLMHDFTYGRSAAAPALVYVAEDSNGLDFAFDVEERGPITATQQTNGPGVLNDDNVTVDLYPQGTQGIAYAFYVNARGARYQTSSENVSYFPQWTASAHLTASGYAVTMHIPFDIVRSGGSSVWRAQFERQTISSGAVDVWSYDARQRYADDPAFAGTLHVSMPSRAAATRTKARLEVYTLGELTPGDNGGNTSRVGLNAALPITPTSSFIATFHPDFSNVEQDQQTIAPNAFPRQYDEVRPFFTQAAANFNYHTGGNSNTPVTLYTPAIPAFAQGYGYSGTQGNMLFGAFSALGNQRTDSAQTVNYSFSNTRTSFNADAQNVSVDTPDLHDETLTFGGQYTDQLLHTYVRAYAGEESGTLVTSPQDGKYSEFTLGYATRTTLAEVDAQNIGSLFNPVDGYEAQPGIAGYFSSLHRTITFGSGSPLHDVFVDTYLGRYHDRNQNPAQTDGGWQVNFDARNLLTLQLFQGSEGVQIYDGEFLPFNANGALLGYRLSTSTPSWVSFSDGPFFHGYLGSWSYVLTHPVRANATLRLELDENTYSPGAGEPQARQWLERASIDWQLNRIASVDLGIRKIVGRNLPNSFQSPDLPTAALPCGTFNGASPFDCVDATNVSAAFHLLAAHNEFYFVYGNADSLLTVPALYVKWVRYVGASKGT